MLLKLLWKPEIRHRTFHERQLLAALLHGLNQALRFRQWGKGAQKHVNGADFSKAIDPDRISCILFILALAICIVYSVTDAD